MSDYQIHEVVATLVAIFLLLSPLLSLLAAQTIRSGAWHLPSGLARIGVPAAHAFAWAPIACIASFASLVLRIRLEAGEWPRAGVEPPDSWTWLVHGSVTAILFLIAVVSVVPLFDLGVLLAAAGRKLRFHEWIAFAAGYVLLWTLMTLDPGRFLSWFWD